MDRREGQDRLLDLDEDADDEAATITRAVQGLKKFRKFLGSKVTGALFTSADDLGGEVATSLHKWLVEEALKAVSVSAVAGSRDVMRTVQTAPTWTGSPFPGLRAFTPDDAPIFFGRGRDTDALVRKLCDSQCRFILIVGTSGSGKSSPVAAGLIPRLADGAVPGSDRWLLPSVHTVGRGKAWLGLRFTPAEQGDDPSLALASKLAPMLPDGPKPQDVAKALHDDPDELVRLVERALEWQQAATGGQDRDTYPWGRDWEEGRANTSESRLGRTTAVGMYPRGASAQGALDLSGNVWEWCVNPRDALREQVAEKADRVVRGGSWGNDRDGARATYRNNNDPDNRNNNIGFRVVCSAHRAGQGTGARV